MVFKKDEKGVACAKRMTEKNDPQKKRVCRVSKSSENDCLMMIRTVQRRILPPYLSFSRTPGDQEQVFFMATTSGPYPWSRAGTLGSKMDCSLDRRSRACVSTPSARGHTAVLVEHHGWNYYSSAMSLDVG